MKTTLYTNEEITEMTAHHTLNMQEGWTMTEADYQTMEDEQFNSSVWEDWEAKVQAQIDRDHAISDAQHPIHQMDEYHENCM